MASSQRNISQISSVGNIETDLQALFEPGANQPQQVPWSMRKLPDSFFNPPTTGSKSIDHSRDNSTDSGTYTSPGNFSTSSLNSIPLRTVHHRAHSSPASFQDTQNFGKQYSCHQHNKQRSYDVLQNTNNAPLPFGWEEARTPEGQVYYLNHISKTTTWEDPRKSISHSTLTPFTAAKLPSKSSGFCDNLLGPLPEGWEQSITLEGEVYFINHVTCTTSWYDPRIPHHLQTVSSEASPDTPYWLNNSGRNSQYIKQQDLRLQSLHLERERLKERREELKKQLLLRSGSNTVFQNIEHSHQTSSDSAIGESLKDWMPTEASMGDSSTSQDNFICGESTIDMNNVSHALPVPYMPDIDESIIYIDNIPPLHIQRDFDN